MGGGQREAAPTGVVKALDARGAGPASDSPPAPAPLVGARSVAQSGCEDRAALEASSDGFSEALLAFASAFQLDALLQLEDAMPHGFYMEFPGDYFELLPADPGLDANLRRAAYLYLVALSRQSEASVAERVPAVSQWRRLVEGDPLDPAGSFEMRYAQSCMGITGDYGAHGMSAHDIAYLLCRPEGWQALSALMRSYHAAFAATDAMPVAGTVPESGP